MVLSTCNRCGGQFWETYRGDCAERRSDTVKTCVTIAKRRDATMPTFLLRSMPAQSATAKL